MHENTITISDVKKNKTKLHQGHKNDNEAIVSAPRANTPINTQISWKEACQNRSTRKKFDQTFKIPCEEEEEEEEEYQEPSFLSNIFNEHESNIKSNDSLILRNSE